MQIRLAERRAADAGLGDRLSFIRVEPGPLPFDDGAFDLVFSKDAIVQVAVKKSLLDECFRVLRPGGVFASSDWLRRGEGVLSPQMRTWIEKMGVTLRLERPERLEKMGRALSQVDFVDVTLRDRRAWYRDLCHRELERMKGPLYARLVEALGQDRADEDVACWEAMAKVLDLGEFEPGHMRTCKPRQRQVQASLPARPAFALSKPRCLGDGAGRGLCPILRIAWRGEPHRPTKTPYTRLREAVGARKWHDSAMKSLFIAFGVFAVGFAILTLTPGVDLIPSGVRAVFDEVETVWQPPLSFASSHSGEAYYPIARSHHRCPTEGGVRDAMTTRFVVMDHGLETSVYKIHAHETARLKNEFGNEGLEVYDSFEAAKEAALLIVNRHDEASKQGHRRFSFQSDPQIDNLKSELSGLTEDRVQTFFV